MRALRGVTALRSVAAQAGLRAASREVWGCRSLKPRLLEAGYRNKSPLIAELEAMAYACRSCCGGRPVSVRGTSVEP